MNGTHLYVHESYYETGRLIMRPESSIIVTAGRAISVELDESRLTFDVKLGDTVFIRQRVRYPIEIFACHPQQPYVAPELTEVLAFDLHGTRVYMYREHFQGRDGPLMKTPSEREDADMLDDLMVVAGLSRGDPANDSYADMTGGVIMRYGEEIGTIEDLVPVVIQEGS